jgi:AAA15 family ATPase/GTPase
VDVLPAACALGANASGKTNLLRAMDNMRDVVLQSYRYGGAAIHRVSMRRANEDAVRSSVFSGSASTASTKASTRC